MKIHARQILSTLTASLLLSATYAGDVLSVEDRLRRLEDELGSLRQENQQLRKELTAVSGAGAALAPSVVKPAGHEQQLAIGGFLQAQADFLDKGDARFSSANDRIYLRRARLAVTGRFSKEFDFKADIEMAGSLNETSGYRAQLMDGFVNWTRYPFAGVRIGQFKTPYGFEQLGSDLQLFTIERSLVNDRLTPGRQIGAQVSGALFNKKLNYSTGLFNGTATNNNANDNDAFMWASRISETLVKTTVAGSEFTWTVGANTFASKDTALASQPSEFGLTANTFSGQRVGLGVDAQVRMGRLDLWAEYLQTRFKPTNDLPADAFTAAGYYVQAVYNFQPKFWQGTAKFETFDPNTTRAGNSTDTWTLAANYLFGGEDFKLMLDYLLINAAGQPDNRQKILVRFQTIF